MRNVLVTRRGFLDRIVDGVRVTGVAGALTTMGAARAAAQRDSNPWAYDLERYLTTDPALVHYRERSAFECPRSQARCLARDGAGRLWLAAGRTICALSSEGSLNSEFPVEQEARCLAVSEDTLYVAFQQHVAVFDRSGALLARWESPGGKAYFTGIACSKNDVFVADAGRRVVHRYDKSGRLLNGVGVRDPDRGIPGFIVPSPFFSVAMGPDGLVRATNPGRHRVELYTPAGDLELSWGKPGAAVQNFCGCCNPIDLALLPDGRTVTFEKGIPRVKVYSATGEFESVVAGPETFKENAEVCGPNDCTLGGMDGIVDDQGRVLILDFVTNRVRVMERKVEQA